MAELLGLPARVDLTVEEVGHGHIVEPDGLAQTDQSDIARRAGVSDRSVRRALARLKAAGLLTVVWRDGLRKGPSEYRVHPLANPPSKPDTRVRSPPHSVADIRRHLLRTELCPPSHKGPERATVPVGTSPETQQGQMEMFGSPDRYEYEAEVFDGLADGCSQDAGPIDFVRQVQPVLDAYCTECHSGVDPGGDPAGGIDLSGDKTRHFNMAYDNLVQRSLVQFFYLTPPQEETGTFRPLETGSYVSPIVELIEQKHADVDVDDESRRKLYAWIDANVPYYGTYEHTRPGTSGSRDAWAGTWSKQFGGIFTKYCASCHGGLDMRHNRHSTWINLTHPEQSRVLGAPLAKSAGGLGLCQAKEGKQPIRFAGKSDPIHSAMLRLITEGSRALRANPRVDMPGATPAPYKQDFGQLFRGGGR